MCFYTRIIFKHCASNSTQSFDSIDWVERTLYSCKTCVHFNCVYWKKQFAWTVYPPRSPDFTSAFKWVCIAQSSVFCVVFSRSSFVYYAYMIFFSQFVNIGKSSVLVFCLSTRKAWWYQKGYQRPKSKDRKLRLNYAYHLTNTFNWQIM
jgi:hypothetical protein